MRTSAAPRRSTDVLPTWSRYASAGVVKRWVNSSQYARSRAVTGIATVSDSPGFRPLVASFNGGFTRGVYRFGKSVLHVSPGSGQWAGFPMRFFNASEITLLTLRRK